MSGDNVGYKPVYGHSLGSSFTFASRINAVKFHVTGGALGTGFFRIRLIR